jgi:hypothetical protein
VLHAGGDIWSLVRLWATGRPEYQRSAVAPSLVRDTGIDASFLTALALFVLFAVVTIVSCRWLRRFAHGRHGDGRQGASPASA